MRKILLLSELGSLGRDFERYMSNNPGRTLQDLPSASVYGLNPDRIDTLLESIDEESSTKHFRNESSVDYDGVHIDRIVDSQDRSPLTGGLSDAQKTRINRLLGMWEEPVITESSNLVSVSLPMCLLSHGIF